MAEKRPGFFQRTYLIDKRFQLKYVGSVLLMSTAISCILGYMVYDKAREATEIMNITNPELKDMVAWGDQRLLIYLGLFILVQALSVILVGVLMTHRIAGPMYRIRRSLMDLAAGHLKEVGRLRKKDELKDLVEPFNELVTSLRDEATRDKDILDETIQALSKLNNEELKEIILKLTTQRERKIRHLTSAPPPEGTIVERVDTNSNAGSPEQPVSDQK
ncbi:MAG: methyl-accepting chemotaxis protein [Deltaproteobacteria bacterium]|nr:methyl-accepting chemotaxis protein [Deltaproteobacteria bacterium]